MRETCISQHFPCISILVCLEFVKKDSVSIVIVNIKQARVSTISGYFFKISICTTMLQTEKKSKCKFPKKEGHKVYKCESCSKSFSQTRNLKRHINTVHEGHKDYKCESCGKSFSEAGSLKKHIHTIHKTH